MPDLQGVSSTGGDEGESWAKDETTLLWDASQNVVLLIADIEAPATSSQLLGVDSKATMPFAPAVVGDVSQMLFLRDLRASVY